MKFERFIELSKNERKIFTGFRHAHPLSPSDAHDQAELAKLNVAQALRGPFTENEILNAVGNAKTPNAVSRSLRASLPHRRI